MGYVKQTHRQEHVNESNQQIRQQQMEVHIHRHGMEEHGHQRMCDGQRMEIFVDLHVKSERHM